MNEKLLRAEIQRYATRLMQDHDDFQEQWQASDARLYTLPFAQREMHRQSRNFQTGKTLFKALTESLTLAHLIQRLIDYVGELGHALGALAVTSNGSYAFDQAWEVQKKILGWLQEYAGDFAELTPSEGK